jgi:uncharacterized membrane protein
MGPVQVLVVGFDRPSFSGEVLEELSRLGQAGIIRLVDLMLVSRAEDGTLETVDAPPGMALEYGRLSAALLGRGETDADGAVPPANANAANTDPLFWSLAEAVPAGSSAAVALIEHVWAAPLMAAIHRTGGTPLDETWLAPADVAALEELIVKH